MNRDTAVLQLMLAQGMGAKTLMRLMSRLADEQYPVEEFVMAPLSELTEVYGIKPEVAESIKNNQDKANQLSEELDGHDINMLVKGSSKYPAHLPQVAGDTAPPVLFVKGDLAILEKKAVGFSGPRKASQESCRFVSNYAAALAEVGVNVIGGYASGVDLAAHFGAMSAGGATTIVLATGIMNFKLKDDVKQVVTEDNHLVISQFFPRQRWTVYNAMQRNRTICGLADAVIVVEPGLKGGTFDAGKTALELQLPLFVAEFSDASGTTDGNRYFLERGARVLTRDAENKADLTDVFQVLEKEDVVVAQTSSVKHLDSENDESDTPPKR